MTVRPFPVRRIGRGAAGSLEIQMSLRDAVIDRESQIDPLYRTMDIFLEVARIGGFSGDRIAPTASGLALRSREIRDNGVVHWIFDNAVIDPRTLNIAENLAHHAHLEIVPLKAVQIASPLVSSIDDSDEDLPYLNEPMPFDCSIDYEGAQICVEISFAGELTEEMTLRYVSAWDSWVGLAEMAAFADDIYPVGQSRIFVTDEPIAYSETLVFGIDEFVTGDQAFDIMLNMFHRLHHEVLPIESLSIS